MNDRMETISDSELASRQLLRYAEDFKRTYQELKKENARLRKANEELHKSYFQNVLMGIDLISLFDQFLGGHCKRVSFYAGMLAEHMDVKGKSLVKTAALLHDIALVGFPKDALLKIFNNKEHSKKKIAVYQNHPLLKIRPLTSMDVYKRVVEVINKHHEHLDGTGFPRGLKSPDIPMGSRIVAVVDRYDILKQIHKNDNAPESIVRLMEKDAGPKYDEKIFNAFKTLVLKEDPFTKTRYIDPNDIRPGFVLAKEISTGLGIKLLSKDTLLTKEYVESIHKFFRQANISFPICVYNPNYFKKKQEEPQ